MWLMESQQIYAAAQTSPIPASGSTNKPKSPLTPTPAPRSEQSAPTPPAPQGAKAKEVSSLSANDIQLGGPSPTNVAPESSLATTTSDSDKLKVALAEIDRLRAQLSEAQAPSATGLRKRGGGKGAETTVEKAKEVVTGQSGVPLEICVGLVVGVFVLTYLFV